MIASEDTRELIVERGKYDMNNEIERFPRLFRAVQTIAGLTWPTLTFKGEMTLWLGKLEVRLMQLGRGHTKGDTVGGCRSRRSCSAATWSSTARPRTPATPTSTIGRRRSTRSRRSASTAIVPGRGAALDHPAMRREGIVDDAGVHPRAARERQAGCRTGARHLGGPR